MYKVLDIREFKSVNGGQFNSNYGSNSGNFATQQVNIVVAICENEETHEIERFEFYKGYESEFLGETCYYGYSGEFDLLIVGDRFEIKKTSTFKNVAIIKGE